MLLLLLYGLILDYIWLKIVTECYYFQFMRFFFKYMLRCTRQKVFAAACDVRWICHAHCIAVRGFHVGAAVISGLRANPVLLLKSKDIHLVWLSFSLSMRAWLLWFF